MCYRPDIINHGWSGGKVRNVWVVIPVARQTMKQEELKRKLEDFEVPHRNFEEMFEPVAEILSKSWKVWKKSDYRGKRVLLRMLFVQKGSYSSKSDLRTGELSFPFRFLSDAKYLNEVLVEPRGNAAERLMH
ncbi:hypothetical protein [Ruegeria faecimaris]|uniref:hypothetical protein n=1 Tax=Ruegeria faecimaris TaxID=686389 RepID=UPI00249100E7|nr:hypothetical protein [Ruegeria faecimaris]